LKQILLLMLTGCLLTIFGCGHDPGQAGKNVGEKEPQVTGKNVSEKDSQITGKYLHVMTPEIYIELKDDGTYCHIFGKRSKCGKYVRDGNRVIFKSENGVTFGFEIKGKSLISDEGAGFTKQ
jgi:hypothetical protein